MPNYQVHIGIGAVVAIITFFLIKKTGLLPTELVWWEYGALALIIYVYSMLPDLDADVSVINKIWNTAAGLGGIYALYTGTYKTFGILLIASIVFLEWVRHRGLLHNQWVMLGFAAPLWLLNPLFAIVAATVVWSHIISDNEFMR